MKHTHAFCIAYRDIGNRREQEAYYMPAIKTAQRLILALLIFCPFSVFAANAWSYRQENDRLSNQTYSFALSPLPSRHLYDNLRLEIICKDKVLQVAVDADSLIASQNSAFDFEYQIDKNPPVTIQMKTFSDSKRKGYTEEYAKPIIDGILTGQSIFIRINTLIRKVLSAAMPLDNAAEPIKHVMADCGLGLSDNASAEPAYSLSEFEQDFAKLPPERQRQVLDKIKQLMKTPEK